MHKNFNTLTSQDLTNFNFFKLINILLAIILTFLTSITLGNTPYVFLGYGLSAFSLFFIGYFYSKYDAIISYFIGIVLAAIFLYQTASVFLLVAIAFVIVRTIQMIVLVNLKEKKGILASTLFSGILGTFMATLLGTFYYGEGALSTALSFFDLIFAIPAYLAYKFLKLNNPLKLPITISIILVTFLFFFSASTFLILPSLISSLVIFLLIFYFSKVIEKNKAKQKYNNVFLLIVLLILILGYVFFFYSPSSGYVIRTTYYSFYADSLSKTQWYQKETSQECLQGNLAGDWTKEGGVYDPQRLRVIDTCVTVTGTIVAILPQIGPATDGDFIIDIKVDPEYEYVLSIGSYWFKGGYLHIEIIPKDQPNVLANLNLKPGMRVKVIGVWVLDTDHGWWSELHPAWLIEILE